MVRIDGQKSRRGNGHDGLTFLHDGEHGVFYDGDTSRREPSNLEGLISNQPQTESWDQCRPNAVDAAPELDEPCGQRLMFWPRHSRSHQVSRCGERSSLRGSFVCLTRGYIFCSASRVLLWPFISARALGSSEAFPPSLALDFRSRPQTRHPSMTVLP